jgi:hypothetical protein
MKTLYKSSFIVAAAATVFSLSSFKSKPLPSTLKPVDSYQIALLGAPQVIGTNQVWIWSLVNPNPGNGDNGTLQNVSHWSLPLCPAMESALVSAEYSYDQITWHSVALEMERDPSIRLCTSVDVLKFDIGTNGTQPNYYRITFNKILTVNPLAVSYIKTGGGLRGCNTYTYPGPGCSEVPTAPRND